METFLSTLSQAPAQFMQVMMFYILATVLLFSAVMVVTSKNSVHAVLFLILAFFNAAGLFILLGAEFVAMLLVIVYVGAVAVLFLFVVMMLDIKVEQSRSSFKLYMPIGLLAAAIIALEGIMLAMSWSFGVNAESVVSNAISGQVSNTAALGQVLYTYYLIPFQVAGLLLLVAMIGAIVLTHRQREGTLRQKIAQQVYRNPQDVLKLNSVKSGEGI